MQDKNAVAIQAPDNLFNKLPEELKAWITQYLNNQDKVNARRVCSSWNTFFKNYGIQKKDYFHYLDKAAIGPNREIFRLFPRLDGSFIAFSEELDRHGCYKIFHYQPKLNGYQVVEMHYPSGNLPRGISVYQNTLYIKSATGLFAYHKNNLGNFIYSLRKYYGGHLSHDFIELVGNRVITGSYYKDKKNRAKVRTYDLDSSEELSQVEIEHCRCIKNINGIEILFGDSDFVYLYKLDKSGKLKFEQKIVDIHKIKFEKKKDFHWLNNIYILTDYTIVIDTLRGLILATKSDNKYKVTQILPMLSRALTALPSGGFAVINVDKIAIYYRNEKGQFNLVNNITKADVNDKTPLSVLPDGKIISSGYKEVFVYDFKQLQPDHQVSKLSNEQNKNVNLMNILWRR